MSIRLINFNGEAPVLEQICSHLNNGQPIIIPTDTQWGICALEPTIINDMKQRTNKPIIQLVNQHYIELFKVNENELYSNFYALFVQTFWPGQVTIIHNKKAYRRTNAKLLNSVIDYIKLPVYCSSANLTGQAPIRNAIEALDSFNNAEFDILIVNTNDLNLSGNHVASTIIDIDTFNIIRCGARINEVKNFIDSHIHVQSKEKS